MKKKVTYEDFAEFVRNRPKPDTPGFYKLWRLTCEDTGYECREFEGLSLNDKIPYKGKQWRFEIPRWDDMEFEYYATFEDAYRAMTEYWGIGENICYKNPKYDYTFGYQISRLGFGPHGTRDFYVEYWKYDADMVEYDRSTCSSFHYGMPGVYGKFLGRFPDQIKFKKGDLVEIGKTTKADKGKHYSVLGIVIGTPCSVHRIWENEEGAINKLAAKGEPIENNFQGTKGLDVDDEEYFILYGPYEEAMEFATFRHPQEVRPPSYTVPDEARETMMKYYNDYLESLKND